MPGAYRISLVVNVDRRVIRMNLLVLLFTCVEVKNPGLVVVDPDNGMEVSGHENGPRFCGLMTRVPGTAKGSAAQVHSYYNSFNRAA